MQPVQLPGSSSQQSRQQAKERQVKERQAKEQQAEAERMKEVTLLLANLFEREQATLKAVIGCLYDVGTVNLVNQRIRFRPLRPVARPLLRVSKPLLTTLSYRWVVQQCPQLITRWLQGKVKSSTARPPAKPKASPTTVMPTAKVEVLPALEQQTVRYQGEIRRLRSQVRWTTAALAGVSVALAFMLTKIDVSPIELILQTSARPASSLLEDPGKSAKAEQP